MIAKIGRGENLIGALYYNQHKVEQGKGQVLFAHNMIESPDGKYRISQLHRSFEPYLLANRRTEKPVLHISLNPDPKDIVSDEDFKSIAQRYMQKMGYANQPFVVFKHTDIDRTHIHIVSICVDEHGKKISDTFEHVRSMKACRELEQQHNLINATEKKQRQDNIIFKPVNYQKDDIKSQIASVVRYLKQHYKFQSLGGYNALLSLYNITAEEVKGEFNGIQKQGLVYFALNEKGDKVSNPFKASLFGESAGYAQFQSHCEKSKITLKDHPNKASLKAIIEKTIQATTNEINFTKRLQHQGIDTIIRRNKEGRLYGIAFIEHSSKTVWNGSQLGKNISANAFNESWNKDNKREYSVYENQPKSEKEQSEKIDSAKTHDLFNFLDNENALNAPQENSLIEGVGGLLPQQNQGQDYEEEAFAKKMKKKIKQRKR